MNSQYTAVVKKEGDWWIGWIEEVPGVNCQERSRGQLMESLKVTLKEALEFNKQDALTAAGTDFQEEKIAL
jgi:predicted RNase H-like HicB family nuclease